MLSAESLRSLSAKGRPDTLPRPTSGCNITLVAGTQELDDLPDERRARSRPTIILCGVTLRQEGPHPGYRIVKQRRRARRWKQLQIASWQP